MLPGLGVMRAFACTAAALPAATPVFPYPETASRVTCADAV